MLGVVLVVLNIYGSALTQKMKPPSCELFDDNVAIDTVFFVLVCLVEARIIVFL